MGCTSSKPGGRFIDSPPSPAPAPATKFPPSRTLSLPAPLVHHPAIRRGDSHHLVSLTSSTLGTLDLTPFHSVSPRAADRSPSDAPVVIDASELMAGLDECSSPSASPVKRSAAPAVHRSFTFHHAPRDDPKSSPPDDRLEFRKANKIADYSEVKRPGQPLWKHLLEESLLTDMDPSVASAYQRATFPKPLISSSPSKPSVSPNIRPRPEAAKPPVVPSTKVSPLPSSAIIELPSGDNRIVIYFTTLRGIRRTYEDCCAVRNIFAGFRVALDERDISMDSSFRKELQNVLGQKSVTLPQVFIRRKHIGGAEEIRQLHETGELAKLLQGFPVKDRGFSCQSCGDVRFVPCGNCNGSRKVFHEEDEQLRRCPECNENGLVRCSDCCW